MRRVNRLSSAARVLVAASTLSWATITAAQIVCPYPLVYTGQTVTTTDPLTGCPTMPLTGPGAPLLPLDPALQPKFVYDLPVPVDYTPDKTTFPGFDYYEIQMAPVTHPSVAFPQPVSPVTLQPMTVPAGKQWLGLVDPLTLTPIFTPVWGYGPVNAAQSPLGAIATYPAMNFRATKGTPVKVKWINNAPDNHLFCPAPTNANVPCAIDRTLMGVLVRANESVNPYGGPMQPDNAMVVHLHGGEIPPDSDGFAELWFGNATTAAAYAEGGGIWQAPTNTVNGAVQNIDPHFVPPATGHGILNPDLASLIWNGNSTQSGDPFVTNLTALGNLIRPTGNSMIYNYPMVQRAATIWYHDHALGKTRINVAAGPAGFFIVEDPANEPAGLPKGDCSTAGVLAGNCHDIPIVFQDRSFNADGSINFPNFLGQAVALNPLAPGDVPTVHPQWLPEYFGDTSVVNGVIWPRLKVEPRPYRFRFLNGSNARCYSLELKAPGNLIGSPQFTVIATEQGYLPAPVVTKRFDFCPGERLEVVIDFAPYNGLQVFVTNGAGAPFPNGAKPSGVWAGLRQLMRFDVVKPTNTTFPIQPLPVALAPAIAPLVANAPAREMVLNEVLDPLTGAPLRVQIDGKPFEAPVTETPKRGTTEAWSFINTTVDAHPIHLHLVQFQVVSRQKFDVRKYGQAIGLVNLVNGGTLTKVPVAPYTFSKPSPPAAHEAGWKDTVQAFPGEVTTVIAKWDGAWSECVTGGACAVPAPAGGPFWQPVTSGPYVWHCHIVDHEDNEMMRPALVIP